MALKKDSGVKNSLPATSITEAYQRHFESLKRFVSKLLPNPKDSEDAVQEAFLRAYAAEKKKIIDQPKSYLFRVSKNIALSQLRERKRRPTDYIEDYDHSSVLEGNHSAEEYAIADQTLGIHCEAVARLPPRCRQVYLLRKVYGMSYKEIADTLKISVSTVETQLEKGFTRCSEYVTRKLSDEPVRPAPKEQGKRQKHEEK